MPYDFLGIMHRLLCLRRADDDHAPLILCYPVSDNPLQRSSRISARVIRPNAIDCILETPDQSRYPRLVDEVVVVT